MTPDHAAFADWDAAYLLGALAPADRRAYEQHLEECERCRDAIAELALMPGLLARARPLVEGAEDPALRAGPPADLLDRVVGRRERQRRGLRRRIVAGLLAAAALLAVAIALPLALLRPAAPELSLALAPVGGSSASSMTATVELDSVAWGTRIAMECDYPASDGWGDEGGPWSYALVVVDDSGAESQAATWSAVPGRTIRLDAATAVPLEEIAALEVRALPGGRPLLSAELPR